MIGLRAGSSLCSLPALAYISQSCQSSRAILQPGFRSEPRPFFILKGLAGEGGRVPPRHADGIGYRWTPCNCDPHELMERMVILVAEDHEDVRLAIWNILKASGHTVLAAYDGKAALELSRSYPGTIDLLLSDMDMPRMGGLELSQTIATERPGIKVLVI